MKNGLAKIPDSNDLSVMGMAINEKTRVYSGEVITNATTSTLPKDAWKALDTEMVRVAAKNMPAFTDLLAYGLGRHNGGIGTLVDEYQAISRMNRASVSLDGVTEADKDKIEFKLDGVPVPVVKQEFSLSDRRSAAASSKGLSLDMESGMAAAEVVSEEYERMLFNGSSKVLSGQHIYGYTNHPNRNTVTLNLSWAATPTNISLDFIELFKSASNLNVKGPFMFYLSKTEWNALLKPISSTGDTLVTYYDAIKRTYPNLIIDIKVSDFLTAGNVVMVPMDRKYIDVSIGQELTTIGMEKKFLSKDFLVFAVMIHRIKKDFNDLTGIFHGTV